MRDRLAGWVAALAIGIGVPGCRVASVDEARAARERDGSSNPLVEDREGTRIVKILLFPVALLLGGGIPPEADASTRRSFFVGPHAIGGDVVEQSLFWRRREAEFDLRYQAELAKKRATSMDGTER